MSNANTPAMMAQSMAESLLRENKALKEQNALLAVQVQEGWKLVPIEPTADMIIAAGDGYETGEVIGPSSCYRVMIAAAPALPQQVKSEDARECRWTPMDEENMPGTYEGSCGVAWSFIEGGIKENDTLYCPRCGGKIVDVEAISAQDEKEWGL